MPRGDGGAVLIGEEFYITRRTYRDVYNNWIEEVIYNYGDILTLSLNSEGKKEWTRIIPKTQAGTSPNYWSYSCFISPQYLCFVFKAFPRKLGGNVYYSLLSFTGEGKLTIPLLGKNFRGSGIYYVDLSGQISAQKALICYTEKRYKFFTMALVCLP